jgi:polar amino acid transport system substrate-binding protein
MNQTLVNKFAPTGTLRASINLGNPILANRDAASGQPYGISVDLAQELAKRLGVSLELVVFDSARESVDAVKAERADIGFFAIDPLRGEGIGFTGPYVIIEGAYLVREDSPVRSNEDVDRPNNRVVVGGGSAYDLYLTREIKQAQIVRAPTSPAVVDTFLAENAEVAAGVRQQLQADAQRIPGLRLLDVSFMEIRQAMGLPKSRGGEALTFLAAFVDQMIANGFVANALRRHGIEGAAVVLRSGS